MALKGTPAIPELRLTPLTQHALQRHTKRTREQHPSSEMDNSLPSTYIESLAQTGGKDQIALTSEERREALLEFRKDHEIFNGGPLVRTPVPDPIDFIDTRPIYLRTCYIPHPAPQVSSEQNIHGSGTRSLPLTPSSRIPPPTIGADAEESARQSIDSDQDSTRLIKTTYAQEDQLRNILPSHFPQFRHVQKHEELGFYIDRSQYAISVGPGPVDDLQYGIIIVPFGEEHMLFRSENASREVPLVTQQVAPREVPLATQQEPSLRSVDEVQPRITNSPTPVLPRFLFTDPVTLQIIVGPPKQNPNSPKKPSRITKATRTRCSQNPIPTRRSERLKAGRRAT